MSNNKVLQKPEAPVEVEVNHSAERARRQAYVDNYKKANPVKHAHKLAALNAWIAKA